MATSSCFSERHHGYPSIRKAVDPTGRLGTLYDIHTDRLVNQQSIARDASKPIDDGRVDCQLLFGQPSTTLASYLEVIGFDRDLLHHLQSGYVQPRGISRCLEEYRRSIDEQTRFLYYCYRDRQDKLNIETLPAASILSPSDRGTSPATHAISKIIWGYEFLLIFTVPDDLLSHKMNKVLRKIRNHLRQQKKKLQLTLKEEGLLGKIQDITVYGAGMPLKDPITSITAFLSSIQHWHKEKNHYQPLHYILQPLNWLCDRSSPSLRPIDREEDQHSKTIRTRLEQINGPIDALGKIVAGLPEQVSSTTLYEQIVHQRQTYRRIAEMRTAFEEHLKHTLLEVKEGRLRPTAIDSALADEQYRSLNQTEIAAIHDQVRGLMAKIEMIDRLMKDQIRYMNLADFYPRVKRSDKIMDDIEDILREHFADTHDEVIVWCTSDRLKREKSDQWNEHYQHMLSEGEKFDSTMNIELIYLDWSNVETRLTETALFRLSFLASFPPRMDPNDINVLILGETGIGKSTFINALATHLSVDSFEQAEQHHSSALIPDSFPLSLNERLHEVFVRVGPPNPNGEHDERGHSVTQQCRSYVFDSGRQKRIRLIDSPGIGDTRGIEQDKKNMEHVLSYIHQFSHMHAICLLFRPHPSRLSITFQYCLKELFTLIPVTRHPNVIFCFTHTRNTFHQVGQTGVLIHQVLRDAGFPNIPFTKQNTFCFDNESFQYLVARQAGIAFDPTMHPDYRQSWAKSVAESKRLVAYLQTMEPMNIHDQPSTRQICYEILTLARPLMETLRLMLYNWKLHETNCITHQINIVARSITTDLCSRCAAKDLINITPYWVTQYGPPSKKNGAHTRCQHHHRHDILIEHLVEYQTKPTPAGLTNDRWERSVQNFVYKCARLVHFLRHNGYDAENDPFRSILDRFITEEEAICQRTDLDVSMNRRIQKSLMNLKELWERNRRQFEMSKEKSTPEEILQLVKTFLGMNTVRRQWQCVKKTRLSKLKAQESIIYTTPIQQPAKDTKKYRESDV